MKYTLILFKYNLGNLQIYHYMFITYRKCLLKLINDFILFLANKFYKYQVLNIFCLIFVKIYIF